METNSQAITTAPHHQQTVRQVARFRMDVESSTVFLSNGYWLGDVSGAAG